MTINKKLLTLTSILCLLPIPIGFLLWSRLPEKLVTHFNLAGEADGYSSRLETILFLPLLLLVIHLFAIWVLSKDPKAGRMGQGVSRLLYCLVPLIGIAVQVFLYLHALGILDNRLSFPLVLLGTVFIFIGNYLPKTRQNYVFGLRLPWTLKSEENWYRTHRLAGKVWVFGGLLILLLSFLGQGSIWLLFVLIAFMLLVPIIYSYRLSIK